MISRILLVTFTLVLVPVACAQEPGSPVEVIEIPEPGADGPEPVFTIVERMPEFPGGHEAMFRFIQENLKYPEEERKAGVQGVVYVNFVVGEDGVLKEAKVLRGIGAACDAESLRVVKAMPPWTPGMQRGKTVKVQYNLPIRFQLD